MVRTKLEHLPNELLLELLEYVDIRDLFHGFWNLNERLNDLLRSLDNLSYTLDRCDPSLITLFVNQITRLVVDTWHDIDLRQFPSLHSLILHQITGNQLRQIRSELMSSLVYLSTSSIREFSLMPQLAQRIFSNEMPSISHVDLGHVHVPYLRTWSQAPFLHSVAVHCTDPTLISFILASAPNLRYLQVHFLSDAVALFRPSSTVINHPLKEFVLSDPYHRLSFNHVYTLLGWTTNVRKLHLNFSCKVPFIRFVQRVSNRLRDLKQFSCDIDDLSSDRSTTLESIHQVHPCFSRIQCTTDDLPFRTFSTE